MMRSVDTIVLGGGADGLIAAGELARAGSTVLLVEEAPELGGTLREIEFAPGFRAAPLADSSPLTFRSIEQTTQQLQSFSRKDAQRWPEFARQVNTFASFLKHLYRRPAPRIDADTLREYLTLANLALKFRGLGKRDMVELMRAFPMSVADWLDEWFESDRLKGVLAALAVTDVARGPLSGGTAFTFLHRHVSAAPTSIDEAGPKALIARLTEQARAAGVEIATNTAVERFIVREDRMAGVRLASGEEIACREVLSSLDPTRTVFELLDPVHLEVEFMQAVRNIRYRGVTTKVLVALDGVPPGAEANDALFGSFAIAPSIRYVERAYDAVKYGRCSEQPFVRIDFPSLTQPHLAPAGKQVAVLHVQFTPYALREGHWDALRNSIADRAIALVNEHLPGFADRVRERRVMTPIDIESHFGLREGAVSQGEMMLDQILFMRPVAGAAQYAMPVSGLYLCGPGTHPGPGITAVSGSLAARAILSVRSH